MSRVGDRVVIRGITKTLLKGLGAGALIGVALMFPLPTALVLKEFKKYQWEQAKKRGSLRATIRRLEKQKLVSWQDVDGQLRLVLTPVGSKRVQKYTFEDLSIEKNKKWDGLLRMVIFDIPEPKKKSREVFRKKLREMEFYQLQKSVFVCPYVCKDEIDFLKDYLGVGPYVQLVVAKEIEGFVLKR